MDNQRTLQQVVQALVGKLMYHYQKTLHRQKGKPKMITVDELHEFEQSIFNGVIVGVGSLVLLFSSGVRIMIQCTFECVGNNNLNTGHGENLTTSTLLFPLLNEKVESCFMIDGEILNLYFCNNEKIRIIPEKNGLESYVITTSKGDYPVISF